MSLFTDILSSIGADVAPSPLQPPVRRPESANTSRPSDDLSKPTARLGINGTPNSTNGVKRKAEEALGTPRDGKPATTKPAYTGTMSKSLASGPATQRPRSSDNKLDAKPNSRPTIPAVSTAPKGPSKGSYAEIIARAKAAQQERGTNQVGMIKHQKEQREKVSYLAQRKAGNEEAKTKAEKLEKLKSRGGVINGRIDKRARSNSPMKRPTSSKGEKQKPIRERAPRPAYYGTMRTQASKPREKIRPARRQDEYLGTDEEDNSDIEEEDYPSDESEDMEAGAFDIDEEEAAAARAARMEDAKEAALEKRLKVEKEERRRKLEELAKKAPKQKY